MVVPEKQREHCRQLGLAKRIHGEANKNTTVEYRLWTLMLSRCYNPAASAYKNYGGRGITVDDRWRASYPNFLADLGRRPSPEHQLERIDNNGNYAPGNVRWATRVEQQRNTRKNRWVTYKGVTRCLAEWAELLEMSYTALWQRLEAGWSADRMFTTPVQIKQKKES